MYGDRKRYDNINAGLNMCVAGGTNIRDELHYDMHSKNKCFKIHNIVQTLFIRMAMLNMRNTDHGAYLVMYNIADTDLQFKISMVVVDKMIHI